MSLIAVRKAKRIVAVEWLKNVQAPIQSNLPTGVRHDMTRMDCVGLIDFPRKMNAHALAGVGNGRKKLGLLFWPNAVCAGDEMAGDFVCL